MAEIRILGDFATMTKPIGFKRGHLAAVMRGQEEPIYLADGQPCGCE